MPPHEETVAVPVADAAPVAVADYGSVEAGLDALELPSAGRLSGGERLRRVARAVLPPVLAI
ncbi:MAG TPA: hypothetical protein VH333_16330, partial [Pseudonocardiaceae bacterium]|nr:hypothetical protein [Pseudonocardiaceae bacterium]